MIEEEPETSATSSVRRAQRRYELRLVTILTLGGGIAALDAQAVFYLMPFIAAEFRLSGSEVGFLGSAVLVGWALSGFGIGWLSDRLGRRKPFLVGAFLCFALLSGLSAMAISFETLLVARLLMGVAEGPVIPVKQAMVMAEVSAKRRALSMGFVQNFGAQLLGTLVGPIIVVAIAEKLGWRSAFLIAGFPGLVVAICIWAFLREPAHPLAAGRAQSLPSKDLCKPSKNGGQLTNIFRNRNVLVCIGMGGPAVAWFFVLLTFVPIVLVQKLHFSPTEMSTAVSFIGLAGAVSAIVVPKISDRFGRRAAIVGFCTLGTLAPLGMLIPETNVVIVSALLFTGCLMLGTFPLFMATLPQESVPASEGATATSLIMAIAQLVGGGIGPIVAGMLADEAGSEAPLYLAIGLAILSACIALLLTRTSPLTLLKPSDRALLINALDPSNPKEI